MTRYTIKYLKEAHSHCFNNESEFYKSDKAACFFCFKNFKIKKNSHKEFFGSEYPNDAFCPSCGLDTIIFSASGFAITNDFLEILHKYSFTPTKKIGTLKTTINITMDKK